MFLLTIVSRRLHLSINSLRAILFTLGLLICLAGIATHIHLGSSSENSRGPLALLDHTFHVTLAVGLLVVLLCVGRGLAKRFRLEFLARNGSWGQAGKTSSAR